MATTLTPLITTTPGDPPTYSPGIADTYSWIPIQNSERPLYAKAVFNVGGDGIQPAPGTYDSLELDPPNKPTTITYKKGADTVAIITLTYVGEDVATVTRTL